MKDSKKTLFISDLHLEKDSPTATQFFLKLLKNCNESVDGLYILGDLFESWIGDDDPSPFHQTIITALNEATQQGVRIYFMHGNRDFLVGKKFLRATGCQLLPDEIKINLYGTPILLMHGDTLCTQDIAYLNWRKKSRHPLVRHLFLMLPLSIRLKIAEKARLKSKAHTSSTAMEIMDVTQSEVERVMQKHAVNVLIHGHTHRPAIHRFNLKNKTAERIVLNAWHDRGSVLTWYADGTKELLEWP